MKKWIINITDVIIPGDTWTKQLLKAVSEDFAIEDLFYELDRALGHGTISLEDFLKWFIRKLARQQYSSRALVKKILLAQDMVAK